MGFKEKAAREALAATGNKLEAALENLQVSLPGWWSDAYTLQDGYAVRVGWC
jgi:hypothetical protein